MVGVSIIKFDLGVIERFDVRAKQTSGIRVPLGMEMLGDKMRSNFVGVHGGTKANHSDSS